MEHTKLMPYVVKASTMLQVTLNMRPGTFSRAVSYALSSTPLACNGGPSLMLPAPTIPNGPHSNKGIVSPVA